MSIICIEGPDGSGKTTVAKLLAARVGGIYIRAPGYTTLGELLRPMLKDSKHLPVSVKCLLFQAVDLDIHMEAHKLSQAGNIVVMDRCGLSDWIYRSAADEPFGLKLMMFLHAQGGDVFLPHGANVVILNRNDELLDKACGDRGIETDEGSRFSRQVRENYRTLSRRTEFVLPTFDTSTETAEQTCDRVQRHMEAKYPKPTSITELATACCKVRHWNQ